MPDEHSRRRARMLAPSAALVPAALALACGSPDTHARGDAAADTMSPGAAERPDPPSWARVGIPFDPRAARPGDTVGTLVLDSLDARPTPIDSTLVGTARFRGALTLRGRTMRHPDHPEHRAVCFAPDSADAERLPRWTGDERRIWFCLEDEAAAARVLAAPGVVRPATITVDRYTIHRGLSDEVNGARLVRVVERGAEEARDL